MKTYLNLKTGRLETVRFRENGHFDCYVPDPQGEQDHLLTNIPFSRKDEFLQEIPQIAPDELLQYHKAYLSELHNQLSSNPDNRDEITWRIANTIATISTLERLND